MVVVVVVEVFFALALLPPFFIRFELLCFESSDSLVDVSLDELDVVVELSLLLLLLLLLDELDEDDDELDELDDLFNK